MHFSVFPFFVVIVGARTLTNSERDERGERGKGGRGVWGWKLGIETKC